MTKVFNLQLYVEAFAWRNVTAVCLSQSGVRPRLHCASGWLR